jgi:predicted nucleotidyltransferase
MLQDADRRLTERFKGLLIEHGVPVYKIIVFGSRARGDAGTDADLDVLVLVEHLARIFHKKVQTSCKSLIE